MLTRPFQSIAPYYLEKSYTEGGGTNAVNVIIVDFRGFDTMLEITVLMIAGLIVHVLLGRLRVPDSFEPARRDPAFNPLMLRAAARVILPFGVLISIYLLLRGHNLPGGVFIAGLVLAIVLILVRIAGGAPLPLPNALRHPVAIAIGIAVAAGTGLGAMALGYPFLTSTSGTRCCRSSARYRSPAPPCSTSACSSRWSAPRCWPSSSPRCSAASGASGERGGSSSERALYRHARVPAVPPGIRAVTAWLLATGIGVLFGTGVWLCLRARTFDVVLGLTLLTYGVNLFIFAMGRVVVRAEPILRPGVAPTLAHYADPLPQALVLTAIVISFAMTAVLLALALASRFELDDDMCDSGVDEPRDEDGEERAR